MDKNKNLTRIVLVIFSCLTIFSTFTLAQENDSTAYVEENRRNRAALDAAADMSPASRALHRALSETVVSSDRAEILREAVKTGGPSLVPYLKARHKLGLGPAQYLDVALVALGETQYVDVAIEDLKSDDAATRYRAVWRLAEFKTKESWRKLYELLDDNASRDDGRGADDYVIMPMSWVTMEVLRGAVEDGPKGKDASDVAAWKAWFAKNKHLTN